jgi:UDP-glucose:(heptosyl)LPS alpha-1,3-glucosyltransferase
MPTVIFVGSGFSRKGAFELVTAIQQLPNFQLIVVGHDKNLAKLKKYIATSKLTKRVLVTGPQKDIAPYLNASDIFCLPSLYDSFPNAILEALCSGLPIVTTDAVGTADAIIENHAGCLCKKESKSIKNALEYVRNNQDKFSANALALSKKYDIKIATQRWLNLYNRLIAAKKESISL